MSRTCARPGCNAVAAATLTYDYAASTAWLESLAGEGHPMSYDLCGHHADGLRVPHGWALQDRRLRIAAFDDRLAS
jgi:hypothetical protein